MLPSQKKLIQNLREETDWNLIILDSARYDIFEQIYDEYLTGTLQKVISAGSSTDEWCRNTFTTRFDEVVYVSANPRINSKVAVFGFDGRKHFYKIIDAWEDWAWDERKQTVPPHKVNQAVKAAKNIYPDRNFIIHYLQPHSPYMSIDVNLEAYDLSGGRPNIRKGRKIRTFSTKLRSLPGKALVEILGKERTWDLKKFWGMSPTTPTEVAYRKVGKEGIRQAYTENLETVLKEVRDLVEKLSGKIIISSDHGQLLGEDGGMHGHPPGKRHPILLSVPWLEVS